MELEGGIGGGGFLAVSNKGENFVFREASSHNLKETHITTQRQVNTSSANRRYRGNDQKWSGLHPRLRTGLNPLIL